MNSKPERKSGWKREVKDWMEGIAWISLLIIFLGSLAFFVYWLLRMMGLVL